MGGRSMCEAVKVACVLVPLPTVDSSVSFPPHISASCLNSGMPNPTLRVVRVVVKGLETRASNSGGMPLPSSSMEMSSVSLAVS